MSAQISAMAMVDSHAQIAEDVEIGPFCTIGPHVSIEAGTRLINHVTVRGHVHIGRDNVIHPGTVIGGEPQDLSFQGSDTRVNIGNGNIIRESVTINRGSEKEEGLTSIGNACYLMACSHVAHDCRLDNHVILANGALLGGHVHIQDHASLSGATAVHHYTTIGRYAFVGGLSRVLHDVPPFMLVEGSPSRPRCINIVALRRNGFDVDQINALSDAHRLLYRAKVGLDHAREILRSENKMLPHVEQLLSFVQHQQAGRFGRGREARRAA